MATYKEFCAKRRGVLQKPWKLQHIMDIVIKARAGMYFISTSVKLRHPFCFRQDHKTSVFLILNNIISNVTERLWEHAYII